MIRLPVVLALLPMLCCEVARADYAAGQKLYEEMGESRELLLPGIRRLSEAMERSVASHGGDDLEKAIASYQGVIDPLICAYEGLPLDSDPELDALRGGFIELLKWERESRTGFMRKAFERGVLEPRATQEQREAVDQVGRELMVEEAAVAIRLWELFEAIPKPRFERCGGNIVVRESFVRRVTKSKDAAPWLWSIGLTGGAAVWVLSRELKKGGIRVRRYVSGGALRGGF